jgi:hypothetical protein
VGRQINIWGDNVSELQFNQVISKLFATPWWFLAFVIGTLATTRQHDGQEAPRCGAL